ncbi:MAG: triose-phosphate isomerase [Hyphomicrobiales bacterium]
MAKSGRRALIAGNWKMNGLSAQLKEVRLLAQMLKGVTLRCDVMVCPPFTLLKQVSTVLGKADIAVGGQDCHTEASGAFTGDVSAEMVKDTGATAVIVGHSERRTLHGETNAMVKAKAEAARKAGLTVIVCLGETLDQRKAGDTLKVVSEQLQGSLPDAPLPADVVVAYEPVWAIGTGLTPTVEEVGEVHRHLRAELGRIAGANRAKGIRILYGGSVKPSNAVELMAAPDVDGALVGGASLKASDFLGIIKTYM